MPQISVIVPVYKVEKYLAECVDSILPQTFTDFELILVDDGSPDNCGKICDEYAAKDSRVRVIHQENQDLSGARNAGIDVAQGEFITFVDSDDFIHPDTLFLTFRCLLKSDADVCAFGVARFQDGEKVMFSQLPQEQMRILSNQEACMEVCRNKNWMPVVCNKLYRKTVFQNVRFPSGRYHEDEAVSHVLMYNAEKVVQISCKLYFYRDTPGSIMHSPDLRKFQDKAIAYSERYQFLVENCEWEMAEVAKQTRDIQFAKYAITAKLKNQTANPQFDMPIRQAFKVLRKECTEQNYEWWLSQYSPIRFRFYLLKKKIQSIFNSRR